MAQPTVLEKLGSPEEVDALVSRILDEREAAGKPLHTWAIRKPLGLHDDATWQRYASEATENEEAADVEDRECEGSRYRAVIKKALARIQCWFADEIYSSKAPIGPIYLSKALLGWQDQPQPGGLLLGPGAVTLNINLVPGSTIQAEGSTNGTLEPPKGRLERP